MVQIAGDHATIKSASLSETTKVLLMRHIFEVMPRQGRKLYEGCFIGCVSELAIKVARRLGRATRAIHRHSCRSVTPPVRRRPSIAGRLVSVRNGNIAGSD